MAQEFIGKSALELTKASTPKPLRSEAFWWTRADGNRGTRIWYSGEEHGIHWWQSNSTNKFSLRSLPPEMDEYDEQRLEQMMRVYYEREREEMIDARRTGFFSYSDYEVANK